MMERMERWRSGQAWMTNVVLCLLGAGLMVLARMFVVENDHYVIGFSGVAGVSVWVYLAAVAVLMTQPVNRATVWIVLGFALGMRVIPISAAPFLSSDIYRYVWDGLVQHAHINPYRYVPGDPALTFLRGPHEDLFANINRRDYARTIYPPVAQMIYYCVTFFAQHTRGMKIAMCGFECVTVAALMVMLRRMGRRVTDVVLYAWCPLLVWEIGGSGHIDAAIMAFVTLALLARRRGKNVLTGLALGAAVLTKFYPLVVFPALWRRRDWKMPAVMAAMTAVSYAMYASVGKYVFGFFGGYEKEEGMKTGTRYFLLDFTHQYLPWVSLRVFEGFCAAVMVGLCWWAWKKATVEDCAEPTFAVQRASGKEGTPDYVVIAMCFAFALMLLFSPHYPWYVAWLIPFLVLTPNWPLLAYLMGFFYLFTTALADGTEPKMLVLNTILYGLVLVGCVAQWAWVRWDVKRWFVADRAIRNS